MNSILDIDGKILPSQCTVTGALNVVKARILAAFSALPRVRILATVDLLHVTFSTSWPNSAATCGNNPANARLLNFVLSVIPTNPSVISLSFFFSGLDFCLIIGNG